MQSRKHSLLETAANVLSGIVFSSLVYQFVITRLWDMHTSFSENLQISAVFTAVSVVRGYFWRRLFNRWTMRNQK